MQYKMRQSSQPARDLGCGRLGSALTEGLWSYDARLAYGCMDVWMYGCMYGLASRLGENMPGWRGIIGGGGVGDGKKKKTPGPAIARVSSRLGEGSKTKGRFVPAVLQQGREWIKRSFSAWAFVF